MTRRPSADCDPTCTSADAFTTPASLPAASAGTSMEDEDIADEAMGVGDTSAVRTINHGAFSTVTLVLDRMSGRYCALKATRKAGLLRAGAALSVVREKQALLALQPHPFVVQLFWTAQDADNLYMLLQACTSHARTTRTMHVLCVHIPRRTYHHACTMHMALRATTARSWRRPARGAVAAPAVFIRARARRGAGAVPRALHGALPEAWLEAWLEALRSA